MGAEGRTAELITLQTLFCSNSRRDTDGYHFPICSPSAFADARIAIRCRRGSLGGIGAVATDDRN